MSRKGIEERTKWAGVPPGAMGKKEVLNFKIFLIFIQSYFSAWGSFTTLILHLHTTYISGVAIIGKAHR